MTRSIGGAGRDRGEARRTPNRRAANARPGGVDVMPALSTPRAFRGSFQRAGALTVTTPAVGRTPDPDCSAAWRNTAIAPIDTRRAPPARRRVGRLYRSRDVVTFAVAQRARAPESPWPRAS